MTATLEFRNVSVRFGSGRSAFQAVTDASFTVPEGTTVGLVGESGSGKSTLARAAVGLVEPSSGSILLDGEDVAHTRGRHATLRRAIQMVFQDPYSCLDPRMTIGESIDEGLRTRATRDPSHRLGRTGRRDEIHRLLSTVQLAPSRASDYPQSLSGGERQRVALARALAAGPRVLLADEITSALDVSVQGAVLNLLMDLRREFGLTVLFISHNLAIVRHVCDAVVVMKSGQIVEAGPVTQVLESPHEEYTRRLVAAVPHVGVPLFDTTQIGTGA